MLSIPAPLWTPDFSFAPWQVWSQTAASNCPWRFCWGCPSGVTLSPRKMRSVPQLHLCQRNPTLDFISWWISTYDVGLEEKVLPLLLMVVMTWWWWWWWWWWGYRGAAAGEDRSDVNGENDGDDGGNASSADDVSSGNNGRGGWASERETRKYRASGFLTCLINQWSRCQAGYAGVLPSQEFYCFKIRKVKRPL